MLGMLTFRLCLLSKPVSPEFAWKPNAKIIQKFRNRRRCGQISTDGRRNRLLHGPADDRCSCNRGGGKGRAAPEGFRPAGGREARTGKGLCPSAAESGRNHRKAECGTDSCRPVRPGADRRTCGVFSEKEGASRHGPSEAPRPAFERPFGGRRGGRGRSKPLPALPVHLRAGRRGGRKTFCGSAPAAENACGIRRNERGEAACGTRPAERERAPGRNRGRAGSGAGNNSAGICAFYRRNFVSLSGS